MVNQNPDKTSICFGMASAAACQTSPVARLADEFFHPRGCEPKALAMLCSALPQPEVEELLELLALRVRQLARQVTRLQEERLSWAAQAVPAPARQASAFSVARHRSVRPFEADPGAASRALCSSSMPLLQEAPRVLRPASAQPRSAAFNIQHCRNGRKAGAPRPPSPSLGELGLRVSAAASAAPVQLPGSLRAAAAHAGLRSVHALHTQLLYTRSPALTRAAAATVATAASVARPLSPCAPTSERLQSRLAEGQVLSAQEVQALHTAAEADEADVTAAATAGEAEPLGALPTLEPLGELGVALARERLRPS